MDLKTLWRMKLAVELQMREGHLLNKVTGEIRYSPARPWFKVRLTKYTSTERHHDIRNIDFKGLQSLRHMYNISIDRDQIRTEHDCLNTNQVLHPGLKTRDPIPEPTDDVTQHSSRDLSDHFSSAVSLHL